MIAGRIARGLRHDLLCILADGRCIVVVSGTNGKTTTAHMLTSALARDSVAHNAGGSNMTDGAVSALLAAPEARLAVLEVDELHLAEVVPAVQPSVVVVLNLSRDQLDRISEVAAVAGAVGRALAAHAGTVVANADDPMVVWAVGVDRERVVWVAAGCSWDGDTLTCPDCGSQLTRFKTGFWSCSRCGLARPGPDWRWRMSAGSATVRRRGASPVALQLRLPGRINLGNATMALAAADVLGTSVDRAAPRLGALQDVKGRYGSLLHHGRRVRMLLVKNPAGWQAATEFFVPGRPVVIAINSRSADGRDVSWLWDLVVDPLSDRLVVAAGDRAADLGVRLAYAEIAHRVEPDPVAALDLLPPEDIDIVANYTAFRELHARLAAASEREQAESGRG